MDGQDDFAVNDAIVGQLSEGPHETVYGLLKSLLFRERRYVLPPVLNAIAR